MVIVAKAGLASDPAVHISSVEETPVSASVAPVSSGWAYDLETKLDAIRDELRQARRRLAVVTDNTVESDDILTDDSLKNAERKS